MSGPTVERPPELITFNWRDKAHWSRRPRPCRICDVHTYLVDFDGRPSHKVCAEAEANGELDRYTPTGRDTR